MSRSTVANWVSNKDYVHTWINLVPELSFREVIDSIPIDSPYYKKYNNMKERLCYTNELFRSINLLKKKMKCIQSKLVVFDKSEVSHQKLSCIAKKFPDTFYLKKIKCEFTNESPVQHRLQVLTNI